MELLYKREQKRSFWTQRINFKLWAKADFTEEEEALIRKYDMSNAMLVPIPTPGLFRASVFLGVFATLVLYVFLAFNSYNVFGIRIGWLMLLVLSAIGGSLLAFIFYHQKRETIFVKDLIHGRHLKCNSVIELVRKEAFLESVAGYFRQVLESAKHWGDTENIPIEPLPPEEAKRSILSGPML